MPKMCKESVRILYQEQASRHTELLFCTFAAVCIPGVTALGLGTSYFCLDSEDLGRGKEARSHRLHNLAKAAGLMLAGSKEKGRAASWGCQMWDTEIKQVLAQRSQLG